MIARVYVNARYILVMLSLVCLFNFTAGAQSRGFSASVSGGVSKAFNNADDFPFATADKGYFIQLSGMFPLGKNWGGIINIEDNILSANTHKAANRLLQNDPNAVSVTARAGNFNITNAGAGFYFDLNFSDKVSVRLAPVVGYSYLQTPQTTVFVDTEPHTTYAYKAGSSSAFFYAFQVRPTLKVSERSAILVNLGYSRAGYKLDGILNGDVMNEHINYGTLNLGLGFQYSFSEVAK